MSSEQNVMPKVSILVPIYNVESYLRECLDGLVNQTLEDIEIICINDGSTDNSAAIVAEYASRDSRIRVINKLNSGYGDSMNRGLAFATGEYLGVAEPDDFVELDMYETLVDAAQRHAADLVKCNYYEYEGNTRGLFGAKGRNRRVSLFGEFKIPYDTPFCPEDRPEVITVRPSIWAGIYRREWVIANGIDFATTPGASFQDTSFAHCCWIAAKTAVVMRQPCLHYRVDNAASSVKSGAKVFAICEEYARTESFLNARGQQVLEAFGPTLNAMRYCSYIWNYNRILPEYHEQFAERWSTEMRRAFEDGLVNRGMLLPRDQHDLDVLMVDPQEFCRRYPDEIEWSGYRVEGWHGQSGRRSPERAGQGAGEHAATMPELATPQVSVIVPVYNVEEYIRECVESLLAQTFSDFEVICVSDGSQDASMAIARLAAGDDERFRFFEKENGGQGSARNFGIDKARGEYVTFLDPDDYYAPETLEELISHARVHGLDYLDFTAHSFYETAQARQARDESYYETRPAIEGVMTGRELFVAYQRAVEYHCSVCLHFFKRGLLDAGDDTPALRFDENLPVHEDELFSPLLIARAERAAYLPKALYQRRVRGGSSMTSGRGLRNVACMFEVQKRLLAFAVSELESISDPSPARGTAGVAADAAGRAKREYVSAVVQRVAELRGIMAEDALLVAPDELARFAEGLPQEDQLEFELLGVQAARQLSSARNEIDRRIGSALLAAPRWFKHRL